jgi:hypothetical protein
MGTTVRRSTENNVTRYKIFGVVRQQSDTVVKGRGCDHYITEIKGLGPLPVVALQVTRQLGRVMGKQVQPAQERVGGGFFMGPEASVDFSDVNRGARQ